jgi:uncharacterized protein YuzE
MDGIPMRYTYDDAADAVFIYLVDDIKSGEVVRSAWLPLRVAGASITASLDAGGRTLGLEFLGASRLFTPETLEGFATPCEIPPVAGGSKDDA